MISMTPYNKLTEEDKKNIVKAYYEKYEYGKTSFADIAESIGVSGRAFSRYLKEQGVNTHRKNKYTLNESYFSNIDSEAKAYFLGLMFADGYVDEKTSYVVLQLIDREPMELLKRELEYTGEIRETKGVGGFSSKNSCCYRINFSSRKMVYDLLNHGMDHSDVTNDLPLLDDELMRHFIRGYFDGDGCMYVGKSTSYHNGKKYEYINPYFSILCVDKFGEKLKSLFQRVLGIENMKTVQSKTAYMVYVGTRSRKNCRLIYDYLYRDANFYFKRKHDKWMQFIGDTMTVMHSEKP